MLLNLDQSKSLSLGKGLIKPLSNTIDLITKQHSFRLVHILSACRRQNEHDPKIEICF